MHRECVLSVEALVKKNAIHKKIRGKKVQIDHTGKTNKPKRNNAPGVE